MASSFVFSPTGKSRQHQVETLVAGVVDELVNTKADSSVTKWPQPQTWRLSTV